MVVLTYNGEVCTGGDIQINVMENGFFVRGVFEVHMGKLNMSLYVLYRNGVGLIYNFRLCVHNFHKPLHSRKSALKLLCKLHQPADGVQHHIGVEHKCHKFRGGQCAGLDEKCTADDYYNVHDAVK